MRIDYSEPRQSYTSSPGGPIRHRSPEQSGRGSLLGLLAVGGLLFMVGFGTGWYFSQQSAKKAYRAAMEQQSLENAPKEDKKLPAQQQPIAPVISPQAAVPGAAATGQQPAAGAQQAPAGVPPAAGAPGGQPLTFFDNLPKGQKNTVLGSGINDKPKPAAPAVTAPQTPGKPGQPAAGATPAKPAEAAKQPATSGYVVQVASFNSRKEAETLKARLVAKGYAATISETTLSDKGTWHRVRIGRHLDKESAVQIANQLMSGAKVLPDQD